MSSHFESMAPDYGPGRPAYPEELWSTLVDLGAIGPGRRVLELGAGSGEATRVLAEAGSQVTAVEPGAGLAALLAAAVPAARVVVGRAEETTFAPGSFDSVVAATSMHWMDLSVLRGRMHAALAPGGLLAVWRTVFHDPERPTQFRARVAEILAASRGPGEPGPSRPTMAELAAGGWFEPVASHEWPTTVHLTPEGVGRLFATFSDWSPEEVRSAQGAAREFVGERGTLADHHRTFLHVLRRGGASVGDGE